LKDVDEELNYRRVIELLEQILLTAQATYMNTLEDGGES
jgi:hypothetical protein